MAAGQLGNRWLGWSVLFASVLCVGISWPSPRSTPPDRFVYTQTQRFLPLAWTTGAERFPQGARIIGTAARPAVPEFYATADPEVSFDARTLVFSGKRQPEDPWQIWRVPIEGGEPVRLTQSADDCIRPVLLPDNRIVYARRFNGSFQLEIAGGGATPARITYLPANAVATQVLHDGRILLEAVRRPATTELYTVYDDGSGFEALRCDHVATHRDAHQLASGDVSFSTGPAIARFTSARTHHLEVGSPGGEIASPLAELAPDRWLLCMRTRGQQTFRLFEWAPGRPPAPVQPTGANMVQPVVVAPRPVPPLHPSGLHDRPGANLLCLNAHESPQTIAEGAIAAVRVYTRTEAGTPELLGRTEVESDGSFYVQVPTERPLRIELIGRSGQTIASEAGWFWMRRGEQRVCVGCHAGPERAPENRVPKILTRLRAPVPMLGAPGGN